jgi:hypothetical protein
LTKTRNATVNAPSSPVVSSPQSGPVWIETRRVKARKRRLVRDDELTSEFYDRMATLCIRIWHIVRSSAAFQQLQHKHYHFRYHCLAVFYKAQQGFKCHLFDIPREPILEECLDEQNNLPNYGLERSTLGQSINVLNAVAQNQDVFSSTRMTEWLLDQDDSVD